MKFYTSAFIHRNSIYVRGIDEDDQKFQRIYQYEPYLFVPSQEPNPAYRTIKEEPLQRLDFDSIKEARDFVKQYENVSGFPIYGMTNFVYPFLNDEIPGEVSYDSRLISTVYLDIENIMGRETINEAIATAPNEITAITIAKNGKFYSFGTKEFVSKYPNVTYYRCSNEVELLREFIRVWKYLDPDVVTGWNIELYDIPYLVNRIQRILGIEKAKELSPWGLIRSYSVNVKGTQTETYELRGVVTLDYMQIYKKFTFKNQESFKLDNIASVELDEAKVDYSEYGDLNNLYDKNFQLYLEYNIKDVGLVMRLEEKLKLLELVFAMAYRAKINFSDTLTTVRQWDVIIHNYLLERNIAVSPGKSDEFDDDFELVGGFVKDPKPGLYDWVVSCDLNSLYPSLIMHYNISPDTYVDKFLTNVTIDELVDGKKHASNQYDLSKYSITANGCLYSKEKVGFLGDLMDILYKERAQFKKLMLEAEDLYEKTKDPEQKSLATKFHVIQLAAKIRLNSLYGALGNKYFRWMSFDNAEAITTSGQMAIKWVEKSINEYLNRLCKTENVDRVIAIDTDSVYLLFEDVVKLIPNYEKKSKQEIVKIIDKFCSEKLEPLIARSYEKMTEHMNAFDNKMKMKREAISDRTIWTAKKRYVMNVWNSEGVQYDKPKLKMVGIEAVKTNIPKICREKMKQGLEIIMNENEEAFQDFISEFKKEFYSMGFIDIASPSGINGYEKYESEYRRNNEFPKGAQSHVKSALAYNRALDEGGYKAERIGSGDKFKFAHLVMPNPFASPVIAMLNDIPLPLKEKIESYLDYETQFDKKFVKPMKMITDAIGWSLEKRYTLDSFFQ